MLVEEAQPLAGGRWLVLSLGPRCDFRMREPMQFNGPTWMLDVGRGWAVGVSCHKNRENEGKEEERVRNLDKGLSCVRSNGSSQATGQRQTSLQGRHFVKRRAPGWRSITSDEGNSRDLLYKELYWYVLI